MKCRVLVLMGCAVVGLALTSCSSDEAGASFVAMRDNFFGRAVTKIPAGEEVVFINDGRNPHNAVAADGSFSTEEVLGRSNIEPGERVTISLDEAGVYEFFCTFHGSDDGSGMAATLVVGDVAFTPDEGAEQEVVSSATGVTRRVPDDFDSIQGAVDAADPGDLVLVGPGRYEEEVIVKTPSIAIRGTDRNEVILDGGSEKANGIQVLADGVAVENMTARNYVLNGFFWTGVEGYRGSYLTAYNNGDYGVYAFDAVDGVFEHSYASGSPDAGFYIGQCYPCKAVIKDVIAEHNALGYSGTNAGGDLYLINSVWRFNGGGIVPNTLDTELLPPQRETTIAGNTIYSNNNADAPAKAGGHPAFGNGIVIAGGVDNVVENNVVYDHTNSGIIVTPNIDKNFWLAHDNVVRNNSVTRSGRSDLALSAPSGGSNCFERNDFATSTPPGLETFNGCDGFRLPLSLDLSSAAVNLAYIAAPPPEVTMEVVTQGPVPANQPSMPSATSAPPRPAVDVFDGYDKTVEPVGAPLLSDDDRSQEVLVSGIAVGSSTGWGLIFSFYGYLLPFVLYSAWTSLAFWDLTRREDMPRGAKLGWIAVILLIPFLGVIAYHAVGKSPIPGWLRAAVVGGGIGAYLLIVGLAALIGGVI